MTRSVPALSGWQQATAFCLVAIAFSTALLPWLNDRRAALGVHPAMSPRQYAKSPHTAQHVAREGDKYLFEYTFKDQNEAPWTWSWSYHKAITDLEAGQFGVPPYIYDPYRPTEQELARRREAIRNGLFRQNGDYVEPDYNAMAGHYMDFAEPLHTLLEQTSGGRRQDKIETLLKFIQDIPYGIPPDRLPDRVIAGVLPPPQMLLERWGDCDSKAVLFASILAHDPSMRAVFLLVPNHILLAVEGIPRPYQNAIEVRGRTYILAEPVGPGRVDLGDTGASRYDRFNDVIEVEPVRFRPRRADPVIASAPQAARGGARAPADSETDPGLISWSSPAGGAAEPGSASPSISPDTAPATAPAAGGAGNVYIENSTIDGNLLTLTLRTEPGTSLMGSLMRGGQQLPRKVLIRTLGDDQHELLALLDRTGDYRVAVFAKARGPDMEFPFALDHRVSHTFELSNTVRIGAVFPDVYTEYGELAGYLEAPLIAPLEGGSTVNFRLKLDHVAEAAVLVGDDLTQLERDGSFWQGTVQLPHSPGQVLVVARAEGGSDYLGVLNYAPGG